MAKFVAEAKSYNTEKINIGKVISVVDILKEVNRALHNNDDAYYRIPETREAISQCLLMFENSGSEDLEKVADNSLSIARITLRMPWVDAVALEEMLFLVDANTAKIFGKETDVVLSGSVSLLARVVPATMYSQAYSYGIAIVVVTILMIFVVSNVKLGLVIMLPNAFPILLVLGVSAYLGNPIDMMTILIGSIALGLVVDDTIHFMYGYQRNRREGNSTRESIRHVLKNTGVAMMITSVVLSSGFLVYVLKIIF